MLNNVNPTLYRNHLDKLNSEFDKIQWSDQFEVVITRANPKTSVKIEPVSVVKASLKYGGFSYEFNKIGTSGFISVADTEGSSVNLDFYEKSNNEVFKFLNLTESGEKILPSDGTFLLPYDWYYNIDIYSLDSSWKKRKIMSGNFVRNNSVEKDYTAEGGAMMVISSEFLPVFENEVSWSI